MGGGSVVEGVSTHSGTVMVVVVRGVMELSS